MESSESFYQHFDNFDSEFHDPKGISEKVHTELLSVHEEPINVGDFGFYNEESIDLQQYLHLGNTPPNGSGDDLLKQFGAYSSSPPVTVNVKTPAPGVSGNTTTTHTLTQGLAGVSLTNLGSVAQLGAKAEASVVNAALSSNATTTQLGFQIKQEVVEEYSVPELDNLTEMPPGEEQDMTIVNAQLGRVGGQQYYVIPAGVTHSEDVVTSSIPGNHSYATADGDVQSPNNSSVIAAAPQGVSPPKKRQRSGEHDKESIEYKSKRQRNNVAVRKSRQKSKVKNLELQSKVTSLEADNEKLNKRVELLTKELTVLRSLFTTVKPSAAV